ncbi:MAG: beta-ketoacyl synthase N-terminal-like domain-containing protein [Pseudanabaenaceae cyanobacterium bins.39]|nr:beta-ketoacyl synthase N-terminal-like domain-containing protein [Pseudanabaenaceae cyanobacterium bins.39]
MHQNSVLVTGIGIHSAIAPHRESTWEALLQGKSGIVFDQDLRMPIARSMAICENALVNQKPLTRSQLMLEQVVLEAIADAGLETPLRGCGLAIGSSRGNQRELELLLDHLKSPNSNLQANSWRNLELWQQLQPSSLSAHIAQLLQTQAPVFAPMAACATANWAITQAAMLIASGQCSMAIATAVDAAITPLAIAGFAKLGVLAKSAVHPFSQERDGFALGEGAAALVLESSASAQSRHSQVYGRVLGWGMTNDAYHETSPNPNNHLAAIALKQCLERAAIAPQSRGYINLHGTATPLNDAREMALVQAYLPDFLPNLDLSATKGATGHTLGATGMMEAAFCLLSLRDRLVPPTVGMLTPDFAMPLVKNTQRSPDLQYALNFSFGFGGQNAIVAFGQPQ